MQGQSNPQHRGLVWALPGALSAVVVVRKEDALKRDWTLRH
jgi:hypothetical protein